MKMITINPNNEPYYSEDFIKGFKCGAERQFEADKADIPIWISCSERLPKGSGQYLVTAGVERRQVAIGYYSAEYGRWYAFSDVFAWMQLPTIRSRR